ncbi:unnamed protein product [Closterium sp. Naga37s-1]|nr:unnamed protein product [Closterium sp. Naga37s-1]
MSRRGFPPIAAPAAGLVALLLVATAAGGVRGSGGNAAPRKLAAGGGGNSPATAAKPAEEPAAELVKDFPRASAEGDGFVVKDSAPSASGGRRVVRDSPRLRIQGAHAPGVHGPRAFRMVRVGRVRGRQVADLLVKHLMEKKGLGHADRRAAHLLVAQRSAEADSVLPSWQEFHWKPLELEAAGSHFFPLSSPLVVVSGCSAGEVAALLHCDRVKDTLTAASPSMRVCCLADSSMFLDVPDVNNTRRVANFFAEVHNMHVSKSEHACEQVRRCKFTPTHTCRPSHFSLPSTFSPPFPSSLFSPSLSPMAPLHPSRI